MDDLKTGFWWYLPLHGDSWTIIEVELSDDPTYDPIVFFHGSDIEHELSELKGQMGDQIIHS